MTSIRQRKDTRITSRRNVTPIQFARFTGRICPRCGSLRGETARLDMPEGIIAGLRPTCDRAAWNDSVGLAMLWTLVVLAARTAMFTRFAQARPRRDSHTWDVVYLAYGRKDRIGSAEARDAMWSALLDAMTRTAGRRRATRLFARVPDNADAMIALRDAGYITYGREMLYVAPYHKTRAARGRASNRRSAASKEAKHGRSTNSIR